MTLPTHEWMPPRLSRTEGAAREARPLCRDGDRAGRRAHPRRTDRGAGQWPAGIGGLKVVSESAWFAARPSGTENVYKIYAESFRGPGTSRRCRLRRRRSSTRRSLADLIARRRRCGAPRSARRAVRFDGDAVPVEERRATADASANPVAERALRQAQDERSETKRTLVTQH